ncbi:MAG: 3-isopropylmalate dehydratase large subunit [Reyranella sp.]|uniref:3-isopropylmalate dehydratase large subunit n=1 Tax=Reyranella sp. TaxID=1929291 RepID=UPI003D095B90
MKAASTAPRTLYDRIWDSHVVEDKGDGHALLYIDGHLLDEHSSAQAFDGLRASGRVVRRPMATLAVVDHNAPTTDRAFGIADPQSRLQIEALEKNARQFGVPCFSIGDARQGISHVVGPEQGFIQPGMSIVCGDSHAATHGAFGALAFGIGTSEVEHVLASQTIVARRSRTMRITIDGDLPFGASAKDLILSIIGRLGTAGATGHVIEYAGPTIARLSMEARMTLCNMSIEAGALCGMIAPDETTFAYLAGRPYAPGPDVWARAVAFWRGLRSDPAARFDREVAIEASGLAPQVTWGTSPEHVVPVTARVPDPDDEPDRARRAALARSLDYMGLAAGQPVSGIRIDKVFIGSCTNGRIEDLRAAASVARGRSVAGHVHALVVPGSGVVKAAAEREGLDRVFRDAGFDWREPGCSMCLAMNADRLASGERSASTSSRNFEGRQGAGGRTHLVSPQMAAAAAVQGCIADVRELLAEN